MKIVEASHEGAIGYFHPHWLVCFNIGTAVKVILTVFSAARNLLVIIAPCLRISISCHCIIVLIDFSPRTRIHLFCLAEKIYLVSVSCHGI